MFPSKSLLSRKPSIFKIIRASAALLLLGELIFLLNSQRHLCADLTFRFQHPNRIVTVTPVNPQSTYSDILTFTYHQNTTKLGLNNANCHFAITGVKGMLRHQLQFLKPYLIKQIILRTRSKHVVYIDWDANFIRRPRNPPVDLVVQSNPLANSTNTGLLIFLNAKKHIPTIDAWIAKERPSSHDQWTWALMERSTHLPILRTQDGDYGENYNWNIVGKPKTTARCNRVIFHLTWFRFLFDLVVILAVVAKVYDFWLMQAKGYCPRRVYLSLIFVVAVVLSVFFKEQYHQQVGYASRFYTERICAIPEIGIRRNGLIVTRQDTTSGPNEFLRMAIQVVGLSPVATFLSFWFSLLTRLRRFARVILATEVLSLATLLCFRRSSRGESLLWCTFVQIRDYDAKLPFREVIGKQWRDGEMRFGLVSKDMVSSVSSRRGDTSAT